VQRLSVSRPKKDPWLVLVGQRLKEARIGAGFTQEQLAEKADLAPRTVQKIEAGQITILISTLRRLRAALDCDYHDILLK
jgi:transcriptional regulator with XRE-family HTH domain